MLNAGANQHTSESRTSPGAYTITYAYDNNGNRTSKTLGGVTENYTCGNNDRILTAGGRSYVTDNNGNITAVTQGGQTTSLTYDYENRVTRIDYPGGAFNTFKYNGLGLRTQKVDSTGTQNYVTDGSGVASPVLVDTSATYTPGLSERGGGVSKFYHGDALTSTRGITNTSQTATDGILYDAFGLVVSRTGTTPTPFGFVGGAQYQMDVDSGLMLLGHRYYDSNTGRFVSQDPIKDGQNWYAYVENNPLTGIDPLGLQRYRGPSGSQRVQRAKTMISDPKLWIDHCKKERSDKTDCGNFVADMVQPDHPFYPEQGTSIQWGYIRNPSNGWVYGPITDLGSLQPGDVIIRPPGNGHRYGHTGLFTESRDGKGKKGKIETVYITAEGSLGGHPPEESVRTGAQLGRTYIGGTWARPGFTFPGFPFVSRGMTVVGKVLGALFY